MHDTFEMRVSCEFILRKLWLGVSAFVLALGTVSVEAKERWLFIGDSITYAGHYTDYVETWLLLNEVDAPEIVNLGLGSEAVSELSLG